MRNIRYSLIVLLFLGIATFAQGQITYVGPDIALVRLEIKAQDIEQSISDGAIKGVDAEIHQLVFRVLANDLQKNNPVESCIEAVFEKCYETFPDATKEVDDVKILVINLLKE